MGKTHAKRIINVRCSAVDLNQDPHYHYPNDKYTYNYPSDNLKQTLIGRAIAEYRGDYNIPVNVQVGHTTSVQNT